MNAARYDLLLKIASGGMGTVYLGRRSGEHGFSRLVAIKSAHRHLVEDADARAMFLAEARISAAIRDPHVVSVQDVDSLGTDILLVMDYVAGGPLSALVATGPIPRPIAARILLDACAGLHAAHVQQDGEGRVLGIVHRDISPHNILVSAEDGLSRITDFGIAKLAQPGTPHTQTGVVRGKVGYFAPEYARGAKADVRSDAFSLGVVAWETLVGRRLFAGANDAETLLRVTQDEAPPPSLFDEALVPFDDVLAKCLARDPAARHASVEAFAEALEQAARAGDGVATPKEVARYVCESLAVELEERRTRLANIDALRESQKPSVSLAPETGALATVVATPSTPRPRRPLVLAAIGLALASLATFAVWRTVRAPASTASITTVSAPAPEKTETPAAASSSSPTATPTPSATPAPSQVRRNPAQRRPPPSASHYPANPY